MSTINEKKDTRTNEITMCHNCGSTGHIYHECKLAIISIGIILYRKNKQTDKIEYLMIRRNESFGFSDFFYGKIINYNLSILENVIDEMTIKEKKLIQDYINDIDIDISENQKKRINTINTLCCNSNIINLDKTISNSFTKWEEPEWGFPKGRRNNNEKELDCALREFEEETGIKKNKISLIENVIPYEEIFIDALYSLDNYQKTEVSKINWFTIDECIKIIRPYNSEKTNMLNNINNLLLFNTIV